MRDEKMVRLFLNLIMDKFSLVSFSLWEADDDSEDCVDEIQVFFIPQGQYEEFLLYMMDIVQHMRGFTNPDGVSVTLVTEDRLEDYPPEFRPKNYCTIYEEGKAVDYWKWRDH